MAGLAFPMAEASGAVFAAALVFARAGAMLMLLPGFGDPGVPMRARLVFAVLLTAIITPGLSDTLPAMPSSAGALVGLLVIEVLIGLGLGTLARMLFSALSVAGQALALQSGLAMAMTFDPAQGQQGAIFSAFLNVTGLTLIFALDIHHLFLAGVRGAYMILPAGGGAPVGDFAELSVTLAAEAFALGIQLAAPLFVFGVVFYTGMGVLSRLMPQAQVFFIAMPLTILAAFALIASTLGAILMVWADRVEAFARQMV